MITLLITIHVLSCIVLILVVLLQAGRGADMGAAFGGASTPMFGSGSSSNPLARMTTITAVAFLTSALFLAVSSARRASVFDATTEPLASPPQSESTAKPGGNAASPPAADENAPTDEGQPLTIPAKPDGSAPAAAPAASAPAAETAPAAATAPAAKENAAPAAPSAAPQPGAAPPPKAAAVPAPSAAPAGDAAPQGAQ